MTIVLDGASLTVEKLVRIARDGEKVELDPAALERIKVCRAMLEDKIAAREIMYGINTGIGEFSRGRARRRAGPAVPALPHLQPRRRHRRARPHRARPRRDGGRASTSTPTATPAAGPRSRRPSSSMLNQRRHAGGVPEGLGRRLRRPRADGPDRAAPDGRGRGLLPGRAHARRARPWSAPASRSPGCRRATAWPPSTAPTSSPA